MNKLLIIGAGGHGKVVYDIAESTKRFDDIYFLDDAITGTFYKSEVVGTSIDIDKYINDFSFIVAIGSNSIRAKVQNELESIEAKITTLIHHRAVVTDSSNIGVGSVIMSNVVVNADSKIGKGVILNTASVVEHDCRVGDFCHISPNATICGIVNIGKNSWVGAGATVINNLNICENVVIGAGSVVLRTLNKSGTYVGVVK
jgi:acetyltransferase EpsM